MPIRVVVGGPHVIVLKGLESLLAREPDFMVVATCSSADATRDAARRLRPDVVLLDSRTPGLDGFEVVRALKKEPISPRVVLLAEYIQEDDVLEATRLGVAGIVLKGSGFYKTDARSSTAKKSKTEKKEPAAASESKSTSESTSSSSSSSTSSSTSSSSSVPRSGPRSCQGCVRNCM
jgi:DNA-binding NarL/FixJ family response regulator